MNLIQFVHEGLGNTSYIVELGDGTAALIDPDRTIDRYLTTLTTRNLKLSAIFETHLHADFVSGARELAARTGAPVFVASEAGLQFPHRGLRPGEPVRLNGVEVSAVGSPGHTPEHLSYVLQTASSAPMLFSGGSLIVGGAARTDLIAPDRTDELTRAQFHTLHHAFEGLPDETLLLPTHGEGSFCSTTEGGDRTSTLGRERQRNPLLAIPDEAAFVSWFPTTFPTAPDYFFRLRAINQAGPAPRPATMPSPLTPEKFEAAMDSATIVDVRPTHEYASGHLPGAVSNPFRDAFAVWLGSVLPLETQLLFVLGDQPLGPVVDECLLVGFERFAGYLQGGAASWSRSGRPLVSNGLIDPREAKRRLRQGALVLDVRESSEAAGGRLPGAMHIPLGHLLRSVPALPRDGRPTVVYCGHGERASTAVSLLERAGFADVANLDGGIEAWEEAGFSLER